MAFLQISSAGHNFSEETEGQGIVLRNLTGDRVAFQISTGTCPMFADQVPTPHPSPELCLPASYLVMKASHFLSFIAVAFAIRLKKPMASLILSGRDAGEQLCHWKESRTVWHVFLGGEGHCRRFRLKKCRRILITEWHCMILRYVANLT